MSIQSRRLGRLDGLQGGKTHESHGCEGNTLFCIQKYNPLVQTWEKSSIVVEYKYTVTDLSRTPLLPHQAHAFSCLNHAVP